MADLTGTYFANNYNNALAPFSQFGTRRLQLFLVEIDFDGDDDFDTWYDPDDMVNAWESNDPAQSYIDQTSNTPPVTDHNTYFAKAVRGIQLNAELYLLGRPAGYYFYFMVAEDTGLRAHDYPRDVQKMAMKLSVVITMYMFGRSVSVVTIFGAWTILMP